MDNLFRDAFTGRVVESILRTVNDNGKDCYEFSFLGTHKKLRILENLAADVWVDDDKVQTAQVF